MLENEVNPTPTATMDEMASLFQPDSLLPVQYFENFRRKVQAEPEKRLMLAVLEDALTTYQKHFSSRGGRGLRLFRETQEWIFREDNGLPFSFSNICDVVGFDPDYIRQGLARWREMKISEFAKMPFPEAEPAPKSKRAEPSQAQRGVEHSRMVGIHV